MAETEKWGIEGTPVEAGGPPTYGTDGALPPSYDEATGPPPSYQSLFGEIQDARSQSSGTLEFLKKLFFILIGTIGCTILIGLIMAIPISMIVIGAEYKDKCPVEDKIPIYLIVAGSVGVFRNLMSLCQRAKGSDNQEDGEDKKKRPFEGILDCFLFVWFICGNVWIYHNYRPIYDDVDSPFYCHKTLYLFAFWITTSTYILIGVMCCCVCCVGICAAAFSNEE